MDLTESFTKRCRAILYFIFERHADWTRTLTALVVMLYNAPYMPLSGPLSLFLFVRLFSGSQALRRWITRKGGHQAHTIRRIFRNKI